MKRFYRLLTVLFAAAAAAVLFSTVVFAACDAHRMDGGIITEQPTCERIGIVAYTCQNDGCDYFYVEKMGNLGHHFESGFCTICQEADPYFVPAESTPAESAPAESASSSPAEVPVANTAPEWEAPFVNPVITAPEHVTLAAPTAVLTAVPEATGAVIPSVVFLIAGMLLILFSAAVVFVLIRKSALTD